MPELKYYVSTVCSKTYNHDRFMVSLIHIIHAGNKYAEKHKHLDQNYLFNDKLN